MALPTAKHLTQGTLLLAASNILSRLLGLARDALLARVGGTSFQTDAYNIAFLLPDLLNHFLGAGLLSITLIPLLSSYLKRDDLEGASRLISEIFSVVLLATLFLTTLCFLFADQIVPLLTEKPLPIETMVLTIRYTRILLFAQLFFVAGGFLMAIQYGRFHYTIPALAPLVYNLSIIVGGLFSLKTGNLEGFCWGVLVGAFIGNFALQWRGACRVGLKLRFVFDLKSAALRQYIWLTLPFLFGVGATFSNELVYRYFGGSESGEVSGLGFGLRIMMALVGVFGGAAGIASYPVLARHCADGDYDGLAIRVANTLERVYILLVPVLVATMVLAEPLVRLYLGGGKFDADSVSNVTLALRAYLPIALPMSATLLIARSFYASKDTWTPSLLTLSAFLIVLPLYWWGDDLLGRLRVPLLSLLTALLQLLFLSVVWARRHPHPAHRRPFIALLKMAVPTTLVLILSFWGLQQWSWSTNRLLLAVELAVWGTAIAGVLLLCWWPLRIPGFEEWREALLRRLKRLRLLN